jgi:hypothetical protein
MVYYIHMELGLVLREPLVLEKVHSFATQTEVFNRLEMVGGTRWGEGRAAVLSAWPWP